MLMRYRPGMTDVESRLPTTVRYGLFAVLLASMVGAYTAVVGPSLGRLRLESTSMLLVPLMTISGLVALPVYRALCRRSGPATQVLTLYGGFFATCAIYGCFMWAYGSDGTPWFVLLALVVGHVLGLPLFLLVLAAHLVLVRVGFYRASGRGPHACGS